MSMCCVDGTRENAFTYREYYKNIPAEAAMMICTPNTGCPVLGVHITDKAGVIDYG